MGAEFMNLVFGVIVASACCFVLFLWIYALGNNSRFKRLIGIECAELTEEHKNYVQSKINDLAEEFIHEWQDGHYTFAIPLIELGLDGYDEGIEDELDSMTLDERITLIEVEKDYLIIEVNKFDLFRAKKEQLDEWEQEGQQDRADYWRDRGVI